jgi:uncharacterized membrane protein SpoIIM required for sporulation
MKRILGCTFLGLLAGFFLGFTTAGGGPLNYPGMWFGQLLIDYGLAPHGDAGFIAFCWGILLQWVLLGFLVGLVLQWRFRRARSPNQQGRANGRQPFGSDTNSTSAAAASRRSP